VGAPIGIMALEFGVFTFLPLYDKGARAGLGSEHKKEGRS